MKTYFLISSILLVLSDLLGSSVCAARRKHSSSEKERGKSQKGYGVTTLLLIDAQNDFHPPSGSLRVDNADQDAERIAQLIRNSLVLEEDDKSRIGRIIATMDTHTVLHIAHPRFWIQGSTYENTGEMVHPAPFTSITSDQIKAGEWIPSPALRMDNLINLSGQPIFGNLKGARKSSMLKQDYYLIEKAIDGLDGSIDAKKWVEMYTAELEASEYQFSLMIWPEHCLFGTMGHQIVEPIRDAIAEWEQHTGRSAEYVLKGNNNWTEMYSALKAEVPVDPATDFNNDLWYAIVEDNGGGDIWIAGQASSHCVNFTTRDLVSKMDDSGDRERVKLLTDCMSPVPGFEAAADQFFADMSDLGVQLKTSQDFLF